MALIIDKVHGQGAFIPSQVVYLTPFYHTQDQIMQEARVRHLWLFCDEKLVLPHQPYTSSQLDANVDYLHMESLWTKSKEVSSPRFLHLTQI